MIPSKLFWGGSRAFASMELYYRTKCNKECNGVENKKDQVS